MLLTAPAWARVGLTVRDEAVRRRAAECLAGSIVEAIEERPAPDARQLTLSL